MKTRMSALPVQASCTRFAAAGSRSPGTHGAANGIVWLPVESSYGSSPGRTCGEARMLDGYIVREQNRAALQWRRSCASDDALKRRIDSELSADPLHTVMAALKGSPSRAA